MTAPLLDTLDEAEFDIPCAWPHCESTAIVMAKGCADRHGNALCTFHYAEVRIRFQRNVGAVCIDCHRPFLFFETHYEVIGL